MGKSSKKKGAKEEKQAKAAAKAAKAAQALGMLLAEAARSGNMSVAKDAIARGASVDFITPDDWTPLQDGVGRRLRLGAHVQGKIHCVRQTPPRYQADNQC